MSNTKAYIITGLPYSGKSVLSRELVRRFGFGFASVDDEITEADYDPTEMNQASWDEVYSKAFGKYKELLTAHKTTVFDGGSLLQSERKMLRDIALDCGADPILVYVNTPASEIIQRRKQNLTTNERAHLKDETMDAAFAMFEEPMPSEGAIIYNASYDLDDWVSKNIAATPVK